MRNGTRVINNDLKVVGTVAIELENGQVIVRSDLTGKGVIDNGDFAALPTPAEVKAEVKEILANERKYLVHYIKAQIERVVSNIRAQHSFMLVTRDSAKSDAKRLLDLYHGKASLV